ncbi:PRELI domain containing 1b isoform X2 [Myxocyprinus asiaticus]|uniref:PRELI domain containing 1b isoform X2 n=1 Tax=Myxocyprinus asiaticus TaxID=70543 RepID=UPI0022213D02|nr:PRELI domain containing 1b isoform X2 [Myxocyprinus asiaticus]
MKTEDTRKKHTQGGNVAEVFDVSAELQDYRVFWWGSAGVVMGKYFFSETDIESAWELVSTAFWQRYPNPYSTHVLTEDVVFREVTSDNCLVSRRLLTKTNRLPRWAERIFPGSLTRSVYIIEDSVVDLSNRSLTTLTWNINHAKFMRVVERCVFHGERESPVRTQLTREAWISSGVFGLSRPIQMHQAHVMETPPKILQRYPNTSILPPNPRNRSSSYEQYLTNMSRSRFT